MDKADKCLTCDGTGGRTYWWDHQCYTTCPAKTAPDYNAFKCVGCSPHCLACSSDAKICYKCEQPWLLEGEVCVKECKVPGNKPNRAETQCINKTEFPMIGPIFSIMAAIVTVVCIIVKSFQRNTQLVPTLIAMVSVFEFFCILF